MSFREKLLLIYLVSASIFRVDLGANSLSFILSPILFVSITLLIFTPLFLLFKTSIPIKKYTFIFIAILFFLGGWCFLRTLFYDDIIQMKRFLLFSTILGGTGCFFLLLNYSKNSIELFNKFILYSIVLFACFSAFDLYLFFFKPIEYLTYLESKVPFYNFNVSSISHYFPRIKGGFIDPNVAGYFLTFIYLLIQYLNIHKNKTWIVSILVILTLSRSAIVVFLLVMLINWMLKNSSGISAYIGIKIRIKRSIQIIALILLCIGGLFYLKEKTDAYDRLVNGVAIKVDKKDKSASIHVKLIEKGTELILNNPYKFVLGYGFGSSFLYTQEYFPGNKYGNFHSEHVTIFFEMGLIGYLIYSILFLIPIGFYVVSTLSIKNTYLVLILLSMILQNIFYQQYLFHYYWLFIGIVWYFINNKSDIKNELVSSTK